MHHTQRLFKGFAQRTMRLQAETCSAVVAAQRAEKRLARTDAEYRRARAELHSSRVELRQIQAELPRVQAELNRTHAELTQTVQTLQQDAVVLHEQLLEQGKHVFAWGLESIGPCDKVSAEEVRAAIAALNPDSPTYSMGLKIAVRVLMLVQAAPKEKKPPTIKSAEYHYKKVLAEFMVKTGMVNQYKKPNLQLIKSAVHVALARPGNKEEGDEE
jgi:multidrug efflux pump subunit AcrA (membrane-fusion protein)